MLPTFLRNGALKAQRICPCRCRIFKSTFPRPQSRFATRRSAHQHSNINIDAGIAEPISLPPVRQPSFLESKKPSDSNVGRSGQEDGPYELISEELVGEIANDANAFEQALHRPRSPRQLIQALEAQDAQSLLTALLSASSDPKFFQSLQPTTSAEIFRSAKLDGLIERYVSVYQHLHPLAIAVNSRQPSYKGIRQAVEVLGAFKSSLQTLLERWVAAGNHFDLLACKTMLRIAALIGDGDTARTISDAMKEKGIACDTVAYNYLFEARCWNNAHTQEWGKLRVTPIEMRGRTNLSTSTNNPWLNTYQVRDGGLKQEVLKHFDEMSALGLSPDSSTFYLLIIALAREGDLEAVSSILKRVWDVDVKAVMNNDNNPGIFEHSILPESPIVPTEQLLFVIAHVYGSNNEISTAFRLVDHISQKFALSISVKTWHQLALWTFILSQPTRGRGSQEERRKAYAESKSIGKVPQNSFEQLWKVFTGEPYNIKPTIQMHNWRIKALWWQRRDADMIYAIQEAWKAFDMNDYTNTEGAPTNPSVYPMTKARENELIHLHEIAKSRMKIRWIRLIVRPRSLLPKLRYRRQVLPSSLSEYLDYWNNNHIDTVSYDTWTGRVRFHPTKLSNPQGLSTVSLSHEEIHGLYVVRLTKRCLEPSFQGQTNSAREARKRANAVKTGTMKAANFDMAWHEMPEVKDWIWVGEENGYAISNGRFRGGELVAS